MNRGGVETWLLQILRHIDRERFQFDFLVHTSNGCAYDDEVRSLGSRIISCPAPRNPWAYIRALRRLIAANGSYDVVHSHVHAFSGWVLREAHRARVPVRIGHSHTANDPRRPGIVRRSYLALCRRQLRRHATMGLAASEEAARSLFGPRWLSGPHRRILPYGLHLGAFRKPHDAAAIRREFGFDPCAPVIAHAGSFREPKNHTFLIDVAAEIARLEPRARFLLVGDGPLRPAIENKVACLGLKKRFRFTGVRADVARLMKGAMDVLLFPSLWEGLPLTVIEAQAAGLPAVASLAVPEEAVVVPPLVRRLALSAGPSVWARAALASARRKPGVAPAAACGLVERSRFNIRTCIAALEQIYENMQPRQPSFGDRASPNPWKSKGGKRPF